MGEEKHVYRRGGEHCADNAGQAKQGEKERWKSLGEKLVVVDLNLWLLFYWG
jgi:hypothetical protein